MDLKEQSALGSQLESHWYYVSKAKMISQHLPHGSRVVLDVGAGVGWFSKWLLANKGVERCICVDPGYEDSQLISDEMGGRLRYVRSIEASDADVVLLMDVLEHVDDDASLLQHYWEVAKPGTTFIITVPAFEFLWSSHDDFLEHRRRYTVQSLRDTISRASAKPMLIHYYFACILPIAMLVRMFRPKGTPSGSDMRRVPTSVNKILTTLCSVERLFCRFNKIGGLTVVASLRK